MGNGKWEMGNGKWDMGNGNFDEKHKKTKKTMNNIIKSVSLLLLITACSGGQSGESNPNEVKQETVKAAALPTPDSFKSELNQTLEAYFELKNALVETDATLASDKATMLLAEMNSVQLDGLSAEAVMLWEVSGNDAKVAVESLMNESDVEVQREHFISLSNAFIDLIKSYGPLENVVYVQHCPMAPGGGADWLSKEENILNPYFGSKMLTCGSVIEKI